MRRNRPTHPRGSVLSTILLVLAAISLVVAIAGVFATRSGVGQLRDLAKGFRDGRFPVRKMVTPGEVTMELTPGLLGIVAIDDDEVDGTRYPLEGGAAVTVTITDPDGTSLDFESFATQGPSGSMAIEADGTRIEVIGMAEIKRSGPHVVKASREGEPIAVTVGELGSASLEQFAKGGVTAGAGILGTLCGGGGFVLFGLPGGILWLVGRSRAKQGQVAG